jgi:hypothetical protein
MCHLCMTQSSHFECLDIKYRTKINEPLVAPAVRAPDPGIAVERFRRQFFAVPLQAHL